MENHEVVLLDRWRVDLHDVADGSRRIELGVELLEDEAEGDEEDVMEVGLAAYTFLAPHVPEFLRAEGPYTIDQTDRRVFRAVVVAGESGEPAGDPAETAELALDGVTVSVRAWPSGVVVEARALGGAQMVSSDPQEVEEGMADTGVRFATLLRTGDAENEDLVMERLAAFLEVAKQLSQGGGINGDDVRAAREAVDALEQAFYLQSADASG
jgi:hypothetical protein